MARALAGDRMVRELGREYDGKPIVQNITDAIYGIRKTICVISRHYLQSEWCSREIQMASYRLFDEQDDVLILLLMEDIPVGELSLYYRMRSLVKRRTYLSWPHDPAVHGGHPCPRAVSVLPNEESGEETHLPELAASRSTHRSLLAEHTASSDGTWKSHGQPNQGFLSEPGMKSNL
ncbi:toll-like receptor 4 [Perca fluviatilis]|uniref:toll-like receptor 4 n=1 Tax=Perca fluviatilis TaxID=8168 RepID=UPI0019627FB2|nr:toll-like receptor 4 [Perca fluviatilis]